MKADSLAQSLVDAALGEVDAACEDVSPHNEQQAKREGYARAAVAAMLEVLASVMSEWTDDVPSSDAYDLVADALEQVREGR